MNGRKSDMNGRKSEHEQDFYRTVYGKRYDSADIWKIEKEHKKETVPKHGLGLKIIREITEQYNGLIDTEYGEHHYRIRVVIPLH